MAAHSTSRLDAKQKWVNAIRFVASHVNRDNQKGLEPYYWLEARDPKHRPASFLHSHHSVWSKTKTSLDLFTWIDEQDKNRKNQKTVTYLSQASLENYLATADDGLLYWQGALLDTTHFSGKLPGFAAFALDNKGRFFIAPHVRHQFQHSSFFAGQRVLCTGMVKVLAGKIQSINNVSGHYQPQLKNFTAAVAKLPKAVWSQQASLHYVRPVLANLVTRLLSSRYLILQRLGLILDRWKRSTPLTLEACHDVSLQQSYTKILKKIPVPVKLKQKIFLPEKPPAKKVKRINQVERLSETHQKRYCRMSR